MATIAGTPWVRIRAFPMLNPPILHHSNLYFGDRCISKFRRSFSVSASVDKVDGGEVRVRFAPSPTGNLHVGGARTALFNYLFARANGGKFVLRIEDTDLERSTRQSEEAVLKDLSWLGLDWDEGPSAGGEYGPYRQSERNTLYKQYAEKLLESGQVYRCFCSNEELERMKEVAKLKQLPPVYMGKWGSATDEEVQEELEKGTPYTYRFRVPQVGRLKINDLIRGEVSWNLDTLGDFVIMRSNGQPVYNFCVTVDDATMAISHVIRAEEHLPNTLRQALIYKALGFTMPYFAHVSLILAPDRSKLSKRHGATSVGQFREMGYLPEAMVNYLALLGWGDGTENEFFTLEQLVEKFSISRVNKSGAVFDSTKLRWMNGQHLRALPSEELTKLIGERWKSTGILKESEGPFIEAFLAAWRKACGSTGVVTLLIPEGTYLVGPVKFSGPCKNVSSLTVKMKGYLKASTDLSKYGSGAGWIEFRWMEGLTLTGGGTFDGRGAEAWPFNNCLDDYNCKLLPTNLKFVATNNTVVRHITSLNSKFFHLALVQCKRFKGSKLVISAPANSPNTDGIHIDRSSNIHLSRSHIRTGDDCISIGQGNSRVTITSINCGPGHGISVGSLGRYQNEGDVSGLVVRNCSLTGTTNGIRIKTWPNSPGSSSATNMTFKNITMNNVSNPIIIDQSYCPFRSCSVKAPSLVKLSDIYFKNIRGTSSSKVAVALECSKGFPCENVNLENVHLLLSSGQNHSSSTCQYVRAKYIGTQIPPPCA